MKIKGDGNIQVGGNVKGDIILQILGGVHSLNDIDEAISQTQKHLDSLQRRKGLIDARILLFPIAVGCIFVAVKLCSVSTLPFLLIGIALFFLCGKISSVVSRINTEINAANSVLVELYKQKLMQRLSDQY